LCFDWVGEVLDDYLQKFELQWAGAHENMATPGKVVAGTGRKLVT
jgi:hypothetical protein